MRVTRAASVLHERLELSDKILLNRERFSNVVLHSEEIKWKKDPQTNVGTIVF